MWENWVGNPVSCDFPVGSHFVCSLTDTRPAIKLTIAISIPPVGWLCTHGAVRQDPVICVFLFMHCSQTQKSSDYWHAGLLIHLAITHHQGRQCNLSYLKHIVIIVCHPQALEQ